tara:strand:+ start:297 stop:989 length:693 start_codon:yes stop_codon:yes gene_type:complete
MTGFLASIKDIHEAKKVISEKIDIIDLKNVDDGALGFVGLNFINEAKSILGCRKISVTLGNDYNPNNEHTVSILLEIINKDIDYVKIGLFEKNMVKHHELLLQKIAFLKTKPICVLFADKTFDLNIIEKMINIGYKGIMIDTFDKNYKSMTEILSYSEIEKFVSITKKNKSICGLSGSLKINDIDLLKSLNPDFLGFRGQLCSEKLGRSNINLNLLKKVADAINLANVRG